MRNKSEGSKRKQSDTDGNVGDEKGEYKKNKKKKTDLIWKSRRMEEAQLNKEMDG